MRVCVLGHRGMLGHVVARYLQEEGCEVLTVGARFSMDSVSAFQQELTDTEPDWCINCIGVRPDTVPSSRLVDVNAELPKMCVQWLPATAGFVQASTDGVFDPLKPDRAYTDCPDAMDPCGLAKRQGEEVLKRPHACVIRCSIIGPERNTARNLLQWFLSQHDAAPGYTNQMWNGITTLAWAKICYQLMTGKLAEIGCLVQPGVWPPVTKCELLAQIGKIWNHPVRIDRREARTPVFRSLLPNVSCPSLTEQLCELNTWAPNDFGIRCGRNVT
jgi:dTDP-4-dehydrorhamnose reductase